MSVEAASFRQIQAGTGYTLSCQWNSGSSAVDPGTVTVTITDADGTAVVEDGATVGSGTDPRTYTLTPAQTASPTQLTAVWTSAGDGTVAANSQVTTYAEIRGDLLFTLEEARAHRRGDLQDTARYPDAVLEAVRFRISEMFDNIVDEAFGTKYERAIVSGNSTYALHLPHLRVTSVRNAAYRTAGGTTWTAYTSSELADMFIEHGIVYRESLGYWPLGRQNVRIGYEHGYQRIPQEVRRVAMQMLEVFAIPSDIDMRASSFTNEMGTIQYLVTPGLTRNAFTTVPDANEVLNRYRADNRVPRIG